MSVELSLHPAQQIFGTYYFPTLSAEVCPRQCSQFEQNYLRRQNLLSRALEEAGGNQAYVIWIITPADEGDQSKDEMDVGN
jgi:hypothetical protein